MSRNSSPYASDSLDWSDLVASAERDSLKAIEDGAKQLVGLNGLISGIYYGALSFAKLPSASLDLWHRLLFIAPVVFWLASLIAAVSVQIPAIYSHQPDDEPRATFEHIVKTKHRRLVIALWLFVFSVLMLTAALWTYLELLSNP